ncbi:MAG: cyclic-phosphate processing receiver domain-containing protein [Planctomycetaceae bacterium]
MRILILEDCIERQALMETCLAKGFPDYNVSFDRDANAFCERVRRDGLADVALIALDHDLEMILDDSGQLYDPGTGRDVAECLAQLDPVCPVIIHSTNSPAAVGMEQCLQDAHWTTHRVIPFVSPVSRGSDDAAPANAEWIRTVWYRTCRKAISSSLR